MKRKEFDELFTRVYISYRSLIPASVYYSPERELCYCIKRGIECRYFDSLGKCLAHMRGSRWLDEAEAAEAEEEIRASVFYLDRAQDAKENRLNEISERNRYIAAKLRDGDYGAAIAEIKRK